MQMVEYFIFHKAQTNHRPSRAFKTMAYRDVPFPLCACSWPMKLVQAASLSPAGLEFGMDDRIASFAPWGSCCSLSQQLGTMDLGQVHPRVSLSKVGWINQNANEPHFSKSLVSSSVALIHGSCLIKVLQLKRLLSHPNQAVKINEEYAELNFLPCCS